MNEAKIKVGDKVRVRFWPMYNDIVGIVDYVPLTQGDSWIIKELDGAVSYVQTFASITREAEPLDDLPF